MRITTQQTILLLLASAAISPVEAQTNAPVMPPLPSHAAPIPHSDPYLFDQALEQLRQKTGYTIIAEDAPNHTRSPYDRSRATSVPERPLIPTELLQQTADSFDYSVEKVGNVVCLKKRFTDTQELPCVTPDECRTALAAIQKLLERFDPKVPHASTALGDSPLIAGLAASLTSDQIQALQGDGLPVASLSPEQRNQVNRFALYIYSQHTIESLVRVAREMNNLNQAELGYQHFNGARQFGYKLPSRTASKYFQVFSSQNTMPSSSGMIPSIPSLIPSEPSVPDRAYYSLREVMERLNQRDPKSTNQYTAADEVATKRVTVAGLDQASPDAVLRALAVIYGLRSVETKTGDTVVQELMLPRPLNAATLPEIDAALRRITPDPLLRLIPPPKPAVSFAGKGTEAFLKWVSKEQTGSMDLLMRRQAASEKLQQTFLRRFGTSDSKEFLPFERLSEDDRNLLALAVMLSALEALKKSYFKPPPPYIAQPDAVVLKGGPFKDEGGSGRFTLQLLAPNSQGVLQMQVGIYRMRYTEK